MQSGFRCPNVSNILTLFFFSEGSPYDKGVPDAKELKPKKFYPIAPDGMYICIILVLKVNRGRASSGGRTLEL